MTQVALFRVPTLQVSWTPCRAPNVDSFITGIFAALAHAGAGDNARAGERTA